MTDQELNELRELETQQYSTYKLASDRAGELLAVWSKTYHDIKNEEKARELRAAMRREFMNEFGLCEKEAYKKTEKTT